MHLCLAGMYPGPQAEQLVGLQLALDVKGAGEGLRRARESGQHRALVLPLRRPDAAVTADRRAESRLNARPRPRPGPRPNAQCRPTRRWSSRLAAQNIGPSPQGQAAPAPGGPGEVELA